MEGLPPITACTRAFRLFSFDVVASSSSGTQLLIGTLGAVENPGR